MLFIFRLMIVNIQYFTFIEINNIIIQKQILIFRAYILLQMYRTTHNMNSTTIDIIDLYTFISFFKCPFSVIVS